MSEDAAKTVESRNSEVDQIRKRAPRASLWSPKKYSPYDQNSNKTTKHCVMVMIMMKCSLIVPERREPKPQMEMRPSEEETMVSKSDSSLSSSLGLAGGAGWRCSDDMAV